MEYFIQLYGTWTDVSEMHFHLILSMAGIMTPGLQVRELRSLKDVRKLIYGVLQSTCHPGAPERVSSCECRLRESCCLGASSELRVTFELLGPQRSASWQVPYRPGCSECPVVHL